MNGGKLNNLYRTIILCVDSYDNGVPRGRFYHPNNEDCCSFQSLSEFLIKMEQSLDAASFPQPFTAVRTFSRQSPPALQLSRVSNMEGRLGTFAIRILFRQNASWQGAVRWVEGEREESFRSALELIFLLDSVLTQKGEIKAG